MSRITTLFIWITFLNITQAQVPGCNTSRYLSPIFQGVEITTVKYATITNYLGNQEDLMMDIYTPTGDTEINRPLIILAHGGIFIFGNRSNMDEMCRALAKLGYVTATISYRLYPIALGFPDERKFVKIALNAAGDMKGSIRYFKGNASRTNDFKIDTNAVFIGGYSAGAVMANHVAYLNPQDVISPLVDSIIQESPRGLDGISGDPANYPFTTKVKAVINMAGALYDQNWISTGEAPLASLHGDADETVPYGAGLAFGVPLKGSSLLQQKATSVGIQNFLVTIPGGTHSDPVTGPATQQYRDQFFVQTTAFFKTLMCGTTSTTYKIEPTLEALIFPNPSSGSLKIQCKSLGNYSLELINMEGKTIYTSVPFQKDMEFESAQKGILPGLYIAKIWDKNSGKGMYERVFITN